MKYEEYKIQLRLCYALINALRLTNQSIEMNLDFYNNNHSLYKAKFTERIKENAYYFRRNVLNRDEHFCKRNSL